MPQVGLATPTFRDTRNATLLWIFQKRRGLTYSPSLIRRLQGVPSDDIGIVCWPDPIPDGAMQYPGVKQPHNVQVVLVEYRAAIQTLARYLTIVHPMQVSCFTTRPPLKWGGGGWGGYKAVKSLIPWRGSLVHLSPWIRAPGTEYRGNWSCDSPPTTSSGRKLLIFV